MAYPDGSSVENVYDLLGRLTNVIDNESQNTAYGYDDAGRLTSQTYPNGWNVSKAIQKNNCTCESQKRGGTKTATFLCRQKGLLKYLNIPTVPFTIMPFLPAVTV